jgi:hypothetical protein
LAQAPNISIRLCRASGSWIATQADVRPRRVETGARRA